MEVTAPRYQEKLFWLILTILALVFSAHVTVVNIGWRTTAEAKVDPELLAMSEDQPDGVVRVIVLGRSEEAHRAIEWSDGTVIHDLPLIDATVAMIPAAQATAIAAQPGVQQITLEAAVESSGTLYEKGRPAAEASVNSF